MRILSRLLTALLSAALPGHAADLHQQTFMSTTGSTLVRSGSVTGMRSIAIHQDQGSRLSLTGGVAAQDAAGTQIDQSQTVKTATELTVRFQSGETAIFQIESGEIFHIGDRVQSISSRGQTRITR